MWRIKTSFSVSILSRWYSSRSIKLLFPGQGAQYVGMTSKLTPLCPSAEDIFTESSSVLGYDIKKLCVNGPEDVLRDTVHCQPAIVVSTLVALEQLKHKDAMVLENCVGMSGFSVGEITALIASGAIPLDKGIELVRLRGTLMQRACEVTPSGIISITGLDEHTVNELCHHAVSQKGGVASIANYMFPRGLVVSGSLPTLCSVSKMAVDGRDGVSVKQVNVSGAFHCLLMQSALPEMREFLEMIEFSLPKYDIYSNVTGLPYSIESGSAAGVRELLVQQIVNPVRWEQSVNHMIENYGSNNFIEVGPGKQLKTIMMRISREAFRSMLNVEA